MPCRYDPRELQNVHLTFKDPLKNGREPLHRSTSIPAVSADGSVNFTSSSPGMSHLGNGKPQARVHMTEDSEPNPNPRPSFLSKEGKWVDEALPQVVVPAEAQHVTATGRFTAVGSLRGSLAVAGPKAMGAVHTYNDVSPVVATEFVHDAQGWVHRTADTWDNTVSKLGSLKMGDTNSHNSTTPSAGSLLGPRQQQQQQHKGGSSRSSVSCQSETRKASVEGFWTKMNTSSDGYNLLLRDLVRMEQNDLSSHHTPGTPNTRLIGGKWRQVPRPVVGQPMFTDFYGRYAEQHGNYYGRVHHYQPQ